MIQQAFFYLFSFLTIASSLAVVLSRNPVFSALFLVLGLINGAALMLLLGAEFIALMVILVYVGAVVVLFLFVIMMLDVDGEEKLDAFQSYFPIAAIVALAIVMEIAVIIWLDTDVGAVVRDVEATQLLGLSHERGNTYAIGSVLYTDFVVYFQLAGYILLVAMVGAIVLVHRKRATAKRQDMEEQAMRDPATAVELVKVRSREGVVVPKN